MRPHQDELTELRQRLSRLERKNRLLTLLVAVALIAPALVIVMGQAPLQKTVEANEFLLRDSNGRPRARWSVVGGQPALSFNDTSGKDALTIGGGGSDRGFLHIVNEQGEIRFLLTDGVLGFGDPERKDAQISLGPGFLNIQDGEGYETMVGVAHLATPRTGETQTTSAASVVLFDKDKNLIWKAP